MAAQQNKFSDANKLLQIVFEQKTRYEHIFVGGFSMGGGLVLHLARKART